MKKYICNRYPENPPAYKKENCFHQMSTLCNHDSEPCDATRYVRADVALRHARAEARKAYNLGYGKRDRDGFLRQTTKFEKAVEEAQQAAKREGK